MWRTVHSRQSADQRRRDVAPLGAASGDPTPESRLATLSCFIFVRTLCEIRRDPGARHPCAKRYGGRYAGIVRWNATKKRDDWGVKRQRVRSQSEWLERPDENLRLAQTRSRNQ